MHTSDALEGALSSAETRYINANPKSYERHQQASAVLPGGNTRTVLYYPPFPLGFERGIGAVLYDLDGHSYTDFLGEFSAGLFGHSHPVIMAAAKQALADGTVLGGPNRYEASLARCITTRFPSCELVRFCNSGTEANLMALATARAVTGREAILVFEGAYHGGVLKYGKEGSPINVPFPTIVGQYNDSEKTAKQIHQHAKELAAIIVEPMMGSAGAIPGTVDFLSMLRETAWKNGVLLIFDEVMTSRLSPGGLQEKLRIRPDLTTFGKYLGGGFSLGAFGGERSIMRRYDPALPDSFAHAGTFNNNVLSMAAGFVGLEQVFTAEMAHSLNERGEAFRGRLNDILRRRQACAQVTGLGSLLNLHFQRREIRAPRDVIPALNARALFHLAMIERGFYLARRGYMTLSLALSPDDYEGFALAFDEFWSTYSRVLENE